MAKVNPDKFGSSAPKLEQSDLEAEAAILTISGYEEIEIEDDKADSGVRQSATLTFEETEDKVLWLNKGMIETLVEKLGEDSDDWMGQKIPVEKYTATFGKKKYPKVGVMAAEEWDKAFKEAGVKGGKKSSKPTGGKRR